MKIALFRNMFDYRTNTMTWKVVELYNLNDGEMYGTDEYNIIEKSGLKVAGNMRLLEKDVKRLENLHEYSYKFKIIDENDYTPGASNFDRVNSKFNEYDDFAGV